MAETTNDLHHCYRNMQQMSDVALAMTSILLHIWNNKRSAYLDVTISVSETVIEYILMIKCKHSM